MTKTAIGTYCKACKTFSNIYDLDRCPFCKEPMKVVKV